MKDEVAVYLHMIQTSLYYATAILLQPQQQQPPPLQHQQQPMSNHTRHTKDNCSNHCDEEEDSHDKSNRIPGISRDSQRDDNEMKILIEFQRKCIYCNNVLNSKTRSQQHQKQPQQYQ